MHHIDAVVIVNEAILIAIEADPLQRRLGLLLGLGLGDPTGFGLFG
jgi:hypothetical protein